MDPIELLELCKRGALEGAPPDLIVPQVFVPADFERAWSQDPKRVRRCLDETLTSPFPGCGLELLLRSRAFFSLLPELQAMHNLGDDPEAAMHKDVWEHTKLVVAGIPNQLELRWSALMHDVGKAKTRRVIDGKVTFHNHDFVGSKMVDGIERRLGLFKDDPFLLSTVRSLVLNHLRPAGYKKSWSDSGVRRLLADLGGMQNFERLMALSRADLTTKNESKRNRALARGKELEARVRQVFADDNAPRLPKNTMGLILEKTGFKPGPWLNTLRKEMEEHMRTGTLLVGQSVDFYVAEAIKIVPIPMPYEGPC